MPRIVPETRLTAVLKQFREDQIMRMADTVLDYTAVLSVRRGQDEKMLASLDPSMNAYEVLWPLYSAGDMAKDWSSRANVQARKRLFFFAPSEQDVLDRLAVAEVLLL